MGIREKRVSLKMTQEELAEKAGVARQTIINLENGLRADVKVLTLIKIAKALDCKVEEILPQEESEDGGDNCHNPDEQV